MSGLGAAVTLLTRVPIGDAAWDRDDIRRSVKWIPVVGGMVGVVVGGVYAGLLQLVPPLVAAGVAVTAGILTTGAFHEDGLADTVDGFGGGADRVAKLQIMGDPRLGTFGAVALVLSVLLRVAALASLGGVQAVLLVPAVHSTSRWAALLLITRLPPATSGLGAAYSHPDARRQMGIGASFVLLIGAATVGWLTIPIVIVATLVATGVGVLARRQVGGFTGDVLGAAQQGGEVLLLVLGSAWAGSWLVDLPWWR